MDQLTARNQGNLFPPFKISRLHQHSPPHNNKLLYWTPAVQKVCCSNWSTNPVKLLPAYWSTISRNYLCRLELKSSPWRRDDIKPRFKYKKVMPRCRIPLLSSEKSQTLPVLCNFKRSQRVISSWVQFPWTWKWFASYARRVTK